MFDKLLRAAPWMGIALFVALALVLAPLPGNASQAQGQWPPQPTNLQVLPADIDPRELVQVMRGFAQGLGVRCNHCHVGEDPQDLSTHDFASDDKGHKRVARVMMQMVTAINDEHLADLPHSHDARLQVTCATCHHGQAIPRRIEDLLTASYAKGGIEMALMEYDRLHERHYGSWTYDFSERMLLGVASDVAGQGSIDDAASVIAKNLEIYPGSHESHGTLGQIMARAGRIEEARAAFSACVEANPEFTPCQRALQQLGEQQ